MGQGRPPAARVVQRNWDRCFRAAVPREDEPSVLYVHRAEKRNRREFFRTVAHKGKCPTCSPSWARFTCRLRSTNRRATHDVTRPPGPGGLGEPTTSTNPREVRQRNQRAAAATTTAVRFAVRAKQGSPPPSRSAPRTRAARNNPAPSLTLPLRRSAVVVASAGRPQRLASRCSVLCCVFAWKCPSAVV